MNVSTFWFYVVALFAIVLVRYAIVAGGTYLCFYSPWLPQAADRGDILLSVQSAGVFAIAGAGLMCAHDAGLTRLYDDPSAHGLWYLGFSYALVLILQDTYFYFTHRLVHHPALFSWMHRGHHLSRRPTPLTSFAFDPPEAVVQSLFLVAVVFLLPLHWITLLAVLSTMTIWAALNHLGLDHLPRRFPHHWLGLWFIGPSHHALHHRDQRIHFGLYFTFWDRLLGTQDPRYEQALRAL